MALFRKTIINVFGPASFNEEWSHQYETLNLKLDIIMATIRELTEKVDALQVALDAEQEQIAAAIAALNVTIEDLRVIVADGGTAEERQALADKLDTIVADLEATVTPEEETPPAETP